MTQLPYYGEAPVDLGPVTIDDWHEFMHYLYLPVHLPLHERGDSRLSHPERFVVPERLTFLLPALEMVRADVLDHEEFAHLSDPYVYVSARRGYAAPGNPLNRPGWHCDDFGGTDLNYIWCDAYPTRVLLSDEPLNIPPDDDESMREMTHLAEIVAWHSSTPLHVEEIPLGHLVRLTPHVIHDTPIIPPPGGMRSFFKISVSTHRYNLLGNSRNYLLDYDWPLYSRAEVRNQPTDRNSDYVVEEHAR